MDNYINGNLDRGDKGKCLISIGKIKGKFEELEKGIGQIEVEINKKVEEYVAELSSAEIDKLIEETIIIPNMIFSLINIAVAFRDISEKYFDNSELLKLKKN